MATVTIELPPQAVQTESNLRRWAELLGNPELAKVEGRVETDRHGHIIMSPPPRPDHGRLQSRIAHLLQTLMIEGETMTECPVSTADGVKAADVAWASTQTMKGLGNLVCFPRSPEVCVEVLSPGNTDEEIREKMTLYFDAGASEVWLCSEQGNMRFFDQTMAEIGKSKLCPEFPNRIELRLT
jgi:Uma2 family endonuclease